MDSCSHVPPLLVLFLLLYSFSVYPQPLSGSWRLVLSAKTILPFLEPPVSLVKRQTDPLGTTLFIDSPDTLQANMSLVIVVPSVTLIQSMFSGFCGSLKSPAAA